VKRQFSSKHKTQMEHALFYPSQGLEEHCYFKVDIIIISLIEKRYNLEFKNVSKIKSKSFNMKINTYINNFSRLRD
jgi:hypothetical protein